MHNTKAEEIPLNYVDGGEENVSKTKRAVTESKCRIKKIGIDIGLQVDWCRMKMRRRCHRG